MDENMQAAQFRKHQQDKQAQLMAKALNPRPHSIPADSGMIPQTEKGDPAKDSLTLRALSAGGALSGRLGSLHMT